MPDLYALLAVGLTNAAFVAVLALLLGAVEPRVERRMSPSVVRGLWLLLLVKLLTPPIGRLTLPWLHAAGGLTTTTSEGSMAAGPATPLSQLSSETSLSWTDMAAALWILGTLFVLLVALLRIVRFRRLLQTATAADSELAGRVDRLALGLGIRRSPRILLTDRRMSPVVWAFGEPRLVLPRSLVERLSDYEMDTLLVHELAHLERRDHWIRVIELAAVSAYWWLPVAWWARRRLQIAEERCCDLRVTEALPDHRGAYARCLMATLRFLAVHESGWRAPTPILASRFGEAGEMKERLLMILTNESSRLEHRFTVLRRFTLAALALAVLAVFPTLARSGETDAQAVEAGAQTGSLGDLLVRVAERSERNLVVEPGLDLSTPVDVDLEQVTWQEALETALAARGLGQTRVGNVIWIHEPGTEVFSGAEFSGEPIDLDIEGEKLSDVLGRMGRLTGIDFVLEEGLDGKVSVHLDQVPWDQGLDVILRLQGLRYEVEDGQVRVYRAAG